MVMALPTLHGCLVHQAAGFAKIDIFRILADLCDLYRRRSGLG